MASENVKQANTERAERAEARVQKQKDLVATQQFKKAQYAKLKDDPVLLDIITKATEFANYHVKVGRDGVGADASGNVIYFTNEKRVSEFDRSAGNLEVVDYIKRMIDNPAEKSDLEKDLEEETE